MDDFGTVVGTARRAGDETVLCNLERPDGTEFALRLWEDLPSGRVTVAPGDVVSLEEGCAWWMPAGGCLDTCLGLVDGPH